MTTKQEILDRAVDEEKDLDAFSPYNAPKLSLVTMMRVYDALMTLIALQSPEAADRLHSIHESGHISGSLPWLDVE